MKYRVEIDGREREVDVQLTGETAVVSLDGVAVDADVRRMPGGLSMILNGKVFDVMLGGKAERLDVVSGSTRLRASVLSERMRARKGSSSKGAGKGDLRAPMPGRIVTVSVAEGDAVNVGDPLVVIEAMKMQNELRAEAAGVVKKVHVAPEQSVEAEALLVELGPVADA